MAEPVYLSKNGRIKLEKELKQLKFTDRPVIVTEIKRCMEMGDLSENAEYHAAKDFQKVLEAKIADLEDKLSRVVSVDTDKIPKDKVYLFAKVTMKDQSDGEEILYTIAPPDEADPDEDIISVKSPIGQALLGKKVGDVVKINVPAGILKYEILSID